MRIVVVGASGLVGQHVVAAAGRRGWAVTAVARTSRDGVDRVLDATSASTAEWREVVAGHDGVVFAAGVDDRDVPRRPAYPVFHRGNVRPVERLFAAAREEGLTRGVVLGSYFTHFHRAHPRWRLAEHHPYIRSRVEQARAARVAAGFPVAVLELPFVFGRAGDRLPNWSAPPARWARSRFPLVAPPGGTAVTSAGLVADAAVEALEQASGADVPVGGEDITWREMFARVADAVGRPRRVRGLHPAVLRGALRLTGVAHALTGRESGLDPRVLGDLLTQPLFLGDARPGAVADAFRETFRD
ncbi:NAD-dependent epimerase/dehydratase family protein [Saccharothrix obliqua]|uniref:NAD-dependent epimerase/dehydratase family protein n=1 Tax=Saccharothrix obliqua TaxID=2861747 RepID=UPI001C5D663C|nr:NAD(P)H-binding protein [Saccharothrix obliqua]MBW4717083.1 NAD(P)H-binding protein [Saccharothrix obliqua]